MKKLSLIALTFVAAWTFQSCNDRTQDSIGSANESNELKEESADNNNAVTAATEQDAEFSVKAAGKGLTEVRASELAQQKAQSPRVKEYAAMLVADHTKTNEELKSLASGKNITLPAAPGEDQEKDLTKLSEKSGKDFDKEYIDHMISGHKDNIDAFEKASNNATDADIKAFAAKTLPTLKSHLQTAETIRKEIK